MEWKADASALTAFRACPEAFRLRYRKHLRPVREDEALSQGRIFHAMLEEWFARSDAVTGLAAAQRLLQLHTQLQNPAVDMQALATDVTLRTAMDEYAAKWPRDDDAFVVDNNEGYLEANFGHFQYCGLVDRIVRFEDGSRYIMDTKTTRLWTDDDYWDSFTLSQAQIGYVAMERELGRRCDGFYIDLVQFPRRNAKKPAFQFHRHGPIKVQEWQIERWRSTTLHTIRMIEELDRTLGAEQPWPIWENFKYGKLGSFRNFYLSPAEAHDSLELEFIREPWEPSKVREQLKEAVR